MTRLLVFTVGIPVIVLGIAYWFYPEKMFNSDRKVIRRRGRGEKPELNSEWIEIARKKGLVFSGVGLLLAVFFWFV
jgi:hypothetical protein